MVEVPDPSDVISFGGLDQGDDGMPDRTRRAFQSHYDTQLRRSGKVGQAISEIERVYRADPNAVVSVSGGKDSMILLALAAEADCNHRALHYDWGRRFIPRKVARELVSNIRQYVDDDCLFVASYERGVFEPYPENDHFRRNIEAESSGGETYTGVGALAGALRHSDGIGLQLLGLRSGESGKRDRKLDGLYGESLGKRAAFPIREWTARDVWAYIVANHVPYPIHYDRRAAACGDGSPDDYESGRFATFFDPEFDDVSGAAMGVSEWRHRDLEHTAEE